MNSNPPNSIVVRHLLSALRRRFSGNEKITDNVLQLIGWCWRALEMGHTCLPLAQAHHLFRDEYQSPGVFDDLPSLRSQLQNLSKAEINTRNGAQAILHFSHDRVALPRYFALEYELAQRLFRLSQTPANFHSSALQILFGGPGTGKTTSIARYLLRAIELSERQNNSIPKISLAAPTGRAAARMIEALNTAKKELQNSQTDTSLGLLPSSAQTLHRLLGIGRSQRPTFSLEHPLDADIIVVDECSMLDLELLLALLRALKPGAQLLLVGDPDQLAAVEVGAVFGHLGVCLRDEVDSPRWLRDCVEWRHQQFRFASNSQIAILAEAIRQTDTIKAMQIFFAANAPDQEVQSFGTKELLWNPTDNAQFRNFIARCVNHFVAVANAPNPQAALEFANQMRVLTAVREGEFGSEGINFRISQKLNARAKQGDWFHGRVIVIDRNDYGLDLFNGDLGIAWETETGLRVFFVTSNGELRSFMPKFLPPNRSAFALTVHRAQGSEFNHIALVLPNIDRMVLSRELLYTAITRAKKSVEIFADETVLRDCIMRSGERFSNVAMLLEQVSKMPQVD